MKVSQTAVSLALAFIVLSAGIPAFSGQAEAQSTVGGYIVAADGTEVVRVSEGGDTNWTVTRYSGPSGVATYQGFVYVAHDGGVSKLDGTDGSEVWTFSDPSDAEEITVDESGFIFASSDGPDHTLYRIDQSGNEVWSDSFLESHANDVKAENGKFMVAGSDGSLYHLDKSDASIIWESTGHSFVSQVDVDTSGDPFSAGGDSESHLFYGENGTEQWTHAHTAVYWSTAANGTGAYYAADNDGIVQRFGPSGSVVWDVDVGGRVDGLEYGGGQLYAGGGQIHALDPDDGSEVWANTGMDPVAIAYQGEIVTSTPTPTPTATPTTATPTDGNETTTPVETEKKNPGEIWESFLVFVGFITMFFAALGGLGSRSMAVGATAAYVAFGYLAISTGHTLLTNILYVSLVVVIIGMALKMWRMEFGGEI